MLLLVTESSSSKLLKCLFILVFAVTHLIFSQMKYKVLQSRGVNFCMSSLACSLAAGGDLHGCTFSV